MQYDGLFDHDVKTDLPFNFECKAVETLNIHHAMDQSRIDATRHDNTPLVIYKKNNKPILAVMEFTDLIDLLQWATGFVDEENSMYLEKIRSIMKKVGELDNEASLL